MNSLEEIAKRYFAEEGDEQLFPNHTDEDIYTKGFLARDKAKDEEPEELQKLRNNLNAGYISNEKAKLINQLLNIREFNKREIMNFCFTEEEIRKMDTAYPTDYANKIRELVPSWNGSFMVFDYNTKRIMGEFKNIAEAMVDKISKTLTS